MASNNVNGTTNGHAGVEVNGDTNGWNPTVQDAIIVELRKNGGLKRISSTLKQRLDEAGWSEDLRLYIRQLFRRGEATTYDDALAIINRRINLEGDADSNDVPFASTAPDLTIPQDAIKDGAEVTKKEIRTVVGTEK